MEIKYPIFLQDQDKYMYIISSFFDLNRELEAIDIIEKEYRVWDIKGVPLELYLDQEEIKIRVLSPRPRLDDLKEAILNYAKLANPKAPFIYSGPQNNIIELFKAVEEHIKADSFTKKVSRFLKKFARKFK